MRQTSTALRAGLALVVLLLTPGCNFRRILGAAGAGCKSTVDCAAGLFCNGGTCQQACASQADCPPTESCSLQGVCASAACAPGCKAGERCIETHCLTVSTDCLSTCGPGQLCQDGLCVLESAKCGAVGDCAAGETCNRNGLCNSRGCDGQHPCNGGCCDGSGACVTGSAASACGSGGQSCADCASSSAGPQCTGAGACGCITPSDCAGNPNGAACLATGICGCSGTGDCPSGQSCNAGGVCRADGCDAAHLCNQACCQSDGRCVDLTACGNGLACSSAGVCPQRCGPDALCLFGCCDGGSCVGGSSKDACGNSGTACVACTGGSPSCVNGGCNCTLDSDCGIGQACLAGRCGTSCSAGHPTCNGACCDVDTCIIPGGKCSESTTPVCQATGLKCGCGDSGQCSVGEACTFMTAPTGLCGANCDATHLCNGSGECCLSGLCQITASAAGCGNSSAGHICVAKTSCGCNTATDCDPYHACYIGAVNSNTCTSSCNLGLGRNCNGGCCNNNSSTGTCEPDTCGSGGGACGCTCKVHSCTFKAACPLTNELCSTSCYAADGSCPAGACVCSGAHSGETPTLSCSNGTTCL